MKKRVDKVNKYMMYCQVRTPYIYAQIGQTYIFYELCGLTLRSQIRIRVAISGQSVLAW